jgi:hypothetical protein
LLFLLEVCRHGGERLRHRADRCAVFAAQGCNRVSATGFGKLGKLG